MEHWGWSEDYVRKKLVGAQGWVYYNWALENQNNLLGGGPVRKTPGYLAQERIKIYGQQQRSIR